MEQYGLPYKGSKSKYARRIFSIFPKRDNFYDLFCGGCAMTHYALKTNRFKKIVANDINGKMTQLFIDAINGKYNDEKRWISREEFEQRKGFDMYVACVWSFGNNGENYLYSPDNEKIKHALWNAVMFNDYTLADEYGIPFKRTNHKNTKERRLAIMSDWKKYVVPKIKKGQLKINETRAELQRLESLQSLESLERLERLQSLESLESLQRLQSLESLESLERSYEDVEIEKNSIIYCDIPYIGINGDLNGTNYNDGNGGMSDFNHEKFYDWCERQTEPLFVSSYDMPRDRFYPVLEIESISSMRHSGTKTTERVFIPTHQRDMISVPKQLTLF